MRRWGLKATLNPPAEWWHSCGRRKRRRGRKERSDGERAEFVNASANTNPTLPHLSLPFYLWLRTIWDMTSARLVSSCTLMGPLRTEFIMWNNDTNTFHSAHVRVLNFPDLAISMLAHLTQRGEHQPSTHNSLQHKGVRRSASGDESTTWYLCVGVVPTTSRCCSRCIAANDQSRFCEVVSLVGLF